MTPWDVLDALVVAAVIAVALWRQTRPGAWMAVLGLVFHHIGARMAIQAAEEPLIWVGFLDAIVAGSFAMFTLSRYGIAVEILFATMSLTAFGAVLFEMASPTGQGPGIDAWTLISIQTHAAALMIGIGIYRRTPEHGRVGQLRSDRRRRRN